MKIEELLAKAGKSSRRLGRPAVTLSYAQSLDGSIAAHRGARLSLSGRESLRLCHRLRAAHDAILVGIGTILSDDPQLNVRMVKGQDPQPIILDTALRIPEKARALNNRKTPWIITSMTSRKRRHLLSQKGARIIPAKLNRRREIDLKALLVALKRENIKSLMVEGGARVITSFLRSGLVDQFVITVAPIIIGGLHAVEKPPYPVHSTSIRMNGAAWYGKDLVIWGDTRYRGR